MSPFSLQQQEALADFLMQILHNLVQVLQEQEASHPLAMETPLISIYVHRWEEPHLPTKEWQLLP